MTETPAEKAEARAIRRRWITIGELVAVAGVLIAAASLWLSWADRKADEAERSTAASKAAVAETRLELRAAVIEGGRQVELGDPAHDILDTSVTFPASLGVSTRSPATPRIAAEWFTAHVRDATDGGSDRIEGRLPVLVDVTYRAGDATRRDRAIVEIVWRTSGRMLAGRGLRIEAARVRERGGDQARIDALWAAELKRITTL